MSSYRLPNPLRYLPSALLLGGVGWVGLIILMNYTLPLVGPRWLFFFLVVPALTGPSLPVVAFLHLRFSDGSPTRSGVILRQSLWVGVYGATLVWLQVGRALTTAMAVLLVVGFSLIEIFMRLRERSRWEP